MKEKSNNRYSERLRRYASAENKMLLGTDAEEIADYLDAVTDMADELKTIEMFMKLGRNEKKLARSVVAALWAPAEKKETEAPDIDNDKVKVVRCEECCWAEDDGGELLKCSLFRPVFGERGLVPKDGYCFSGLLNRRRSGDGETK